MKKKHDFITNLNIKASRSTWVNKIRDLFWVSKTVFLSVNLATWQQPKLLKMRTHVQFEFGSIDDIHAINANQNLDSHDEAEHNLLLFEAGNKIVVGRFNSDIVFYAWAVFGRKSMHNKFFTLNQNEFIAMRAFVQKKYRGLGLYPYGLAFMLSTLKNEGYEAVFMDIESHNIVSQRSTYRLGTEDAETGYYLVNLLWQQYTFPFGKLAYRFVAKKSIRERI